MHSCSFPCIDPLSTTSDGIILLLNALGTNRTQLWIKRGSVCLVVGARIVPSIKRQDTGSAAKKLTFVRLEVFTAVTMRNGVFWVVTPCGSHKNRHFGGT
jgi:hypothetical protein